MPIFRYIHCVLFTFIILTGLHAQSTNWGEQFANANLSRYPSGIMLSAKAWEYSNGIVLHGIEEIYEHTHKAEYLTYIQKYVDTYIGSDGSGVKSSIGTIQTLDKVQPVVLCQFLYKETGLAKYKTATDSVLKYMNAMSRNTSGGFWHKSSYPNQMWLDGIYMAEPFMAKYGFRMNDSKATNEATFQILLLNQHAFDPTKNLLYHGWDETKTATWANATTGNSPEVWARAMGWYAMALVDVMRYLPDTHPMYDSMQHVLNRVVFGLKTYQDASTGLWYEVMDKGSLSDNWLETSGSGMFIYAIKTAADYGWIDTSYRSVARKGWEGLKPKFVSYTDGMPQITQFCAALGIQDAYSGYVKSSLKVSCPVSSGTQHPHGYCAAMLAAAAMEYPATKKVRLQLYADSTGLISPSITELYQNIGATITITATPTINYQFDTWAGDTISTDPTILVKMNTHKHLTAKFKKKAKLVSKYTLNISVLGNGMVSPATQTIFTENDRVYCAATPTLGWKFAGWTGDLNSSKDTLSFVIQSNTSLTANFTEIAKHTLLIYIQGNGSVAPASGTIYIEGETPNVQAHSASGYQFDGWTGDTIATDSAIQVKMRSDKYLIAHFSKKPLPKFNVHINVIGNGTINPTQSTYTQFDRVYCAATPTAGWRFAGWTGDLNSTNDTVSFEILANINITATFIEIPIYILLTDIQGNGNVTPASGTIYLEGETANVQAHSASGYLFDSWTGDTIATDSAIQVKMRSDKHLIAHFSKKPLPKFNVHINVIGNGTINPTQSTYTQFDRVYCTATPTAGWRFAGWTGDLNSTNDTVSFEILANTNITATFIEIPIYILLTDIQGDGDVTPASGTIYLEGETANVQAHSASGYQFDSWTGDTTSLDSLVNVKMLANKYLVAHFSKKPLPKCALTIHISGNGTVSPATQTIFTQFDSVCCLATPANGWRFEGWSGDLNFVKDTIHFVIQQNTTLFASFVEIPSYKLTIATLGEGSVSPPSGSIFKEGDIISLQAVAAQGYIFESWQIDTTVYQATFNWVMSSDKWLLARFIKSKIATQTRFGQDLEVYPNPANNYLIIRNLPENCSFELLDSQARVASPSILKSNGDSQINTSNLKSGFYILRIIEPGFVKVFKINICH